MELNKSCLEQFEYSTTHNEDLAKLKPPFSIIGYTGLFLNILASLVIIFRKSLRIKHSATLMMLVFNIIQAILISFRYSGIVKSRNILSTRMKLFSLIDVGQLSAMIIITFERHLLLNSSTILNKMNRLSKNTHNMYVIPLICLSLMFNLIMTVFFPNHLVMIIIMVVTATLMKISFVWRILKSPPHTKRRIALRYIGIIYIFFVTTFVSRCVMSHLWGDKLRAGCPPDTFSSSIVVQIIYMMHLVCDPVTYFIFHSEPRRVLLQWTVRCIDGCIHAVNVSSNNDPVSLLSSPHARHGTSFTRRYPNINFL